MSVEAVRARIAEIEASFPGFRRQSTSGVRFDSVLATTVASVRRPSDAGLSADGGIRTLEIARRELGVKESPNGSNDGRRIAQYREAVEWNPVGPWCAYFASWAAKEAGVPLGDRGQGFARVADVWSWAQRSGRSFDAGSRPSPGDLMIMDGHMGVVEAVLPDGRVQTIEGNKSNQVARTVRDRGEIIGFVRMG